MLLLLLQMLFAGSFDVPARQPVSVPGDHAVLARPGARSSAFAMLALSSLSKSRRFVAHHVRGLIFFTGAMFSALRRHHRQSGLAWISPGDDLDADWRRHLPRCRRASTPAGGASPCWSSLLADRRLDAACSSGACAASRWSRDGRAHHPAEHLSKWYGQVSGLNDVTVSVPPGITGLLGPNGAGKSTFMKLVTGQLQAEQGRGARARRADLGQPGALSPHRVLSRAGRVLRADDRPRVGDRAACA